MKPLNESVLREFHPLPEVDTTLAQLAGAKLFSKIDALANTLVTRVQATHYIYNPMGTLLL